MKRAGSRRSAGRLVLTMLLVVLGAVVGPAQVRAEGGHMLVEGEAGVGFSDTSATAVCWGATVGYGGRLFGSPLRLYGVMNVSGDYYSEDLDNGLSYASRDVSDVSLFFGPRLYIPVARHIRLKMQTLLGASWSDADWVVNQLEQYSPASSSFAMRFGLGFQIRVTPVIALGLEIDRMIFVGKDADLRTASLTGFTDYVDEGDLTRILFTFGLHF